MTRWISTALLVFAALGCSSESLDTPSGNGPDPVEPDPVEPDPGMEEVVDAAFGPDGGSADSVELVTLYDLGLETPLSATALAFDPLREGELWVTLRQFPSDLPCTATVSTGCAALPGAVALVMNAPGEPATTLKQDDNAWHFMRRPTSIAFGDNGNLATCGEARSANYEDDDIDFNGPVLWSSDPTIFGAVPLPEQNGTHLDMLHNTPYCMGIAYEQGNVYWAFNGQSGALDRYDFKQPHVVGGEDHTDGELLRYVEGELLRVPEVPSHLVYDHERGLVYVADTGHGRVVRVDPAAATANGNIEPVLDPINVYTKMSGAGVTELVAPGVLEAPSGIVLHEGVLFVGDNATGEVHAFDRDGELLGSLDTGLDPGALAGVAIGPDGKLYLSDLSTGTAYRVDLR